MHINEKHYIKKITLDHVNSRTLGKIKLNIPLPNHSDTKQPHDLTLFLLTYSYQFWIAAHRS